MFEFLVSAATIGLVLLIGGVAIAIQYANIVQMGKDIDDQRKKRMMKKKK